MLNNNFQENPPILGSELSPIINSELNSYGLTDHPQPFSSLLNSTHNLTEGNSLEPQSWMPLEHLEGIDNISIDQHSREELQTGFGLNQYDESDSLLSGGRKEIAFVDSGLDNYQFLIQGFNRAVEVVVLDSSKDELNQITEVLGTQSQSYDAIHIFSHGEAGKLLLGNTVLDESNLARYQSDLSSWRDSFTPEGDLFLYGCSVADGVQGKAFLEAISQLTDADITASTDLTGNSLLDGDWDLEYATGSIEAKSLSNLSYQEVLDSLFVDNGKLKYKGDKDGSTDVKFSRSPDQLYIIAERNDYKIVNLNGSNISIGTLTAGNQAISVAPNIAKVALANITNGISIDVGEISTSQVPDPGTDTVTIDSLYTNGGELYINGGPASTININGLVSTRKIAANGNPETSASIGNSGAISLDARTVNINNGKLLTNVVTPNPNNYQAGDITIKVNETWGTTLFGANFGNTAKLNLNSATIKGGNVTFDAYTAFTPKDGNTGEAIVEALDNLALFGGVAIAPVTSEINVDANSSIDAVNFTAKAQADGKVEMSPISAGINVRVAYGKVDSDAKINFAGKLKTTGNADIQTIINNLIDVAGDTTAVDPDNRVAIGVAVSELYSDSVANITDTAILDIGGNLNLKSTTTDRNSTYARAALGKDGAVAISVAVSNEEGTTKAILDSRNTKVSGNLNIDATHQKGDPIMKLAGPMDGVVAYSSTNSNTTGDVVSDVIDTAILKTISALKDSFKKLSEKRDSKNSQPDSDANNKKKEPGKLDKLMASINEQLDKVDIVPAIAVHLDTNNAIARIGDHAVVTSLGAIDINSLVKNRPSISGTALIGESQKDPPPKIGFSAAIPLGIYNNNAQAYIGESSQVNAKKSLNVTSATRNEYEFQYGKDLYDTFTQEKDAQGNTLTYGARAKNVLSSFAGYLNNNLGLDKYVFDSWSQSTAGGGASTLGAAASATILTLNHSSKAYIADHAQINQNSSLRSDQQTVTVQSFSVNESVNFSGNIQLPGVTSDATGTLKSSDSKKYFKASAGGSGTDNQNSVGASALILNYSNDVSAQIGKGVKLYADSLKVDAKTEVLSIDVVASGGEAKDKGFNATFGWTGIDNNTIAQINSGSTITVGNNIISGTNNKSLLVNAEDDMAIFSIQGGVAVSNSIGAGASAGVNNITRNTAAFIGTSADELPGTDTNIIVDGDADVKANSDGGIWAFSLAAAVVKQASPPTTPPPPSDLPASDPMSSDFDTADKINLVKPDNSSSEVTTEKASTDSTDTTKETKTAQSGTADESGKGQQGKSGFAFAGDVAVNLVEDNVRAYINTAGIIKTKQLSVTAINDTDVISASGAAAFVTPTAQGNSAGIAGSFSYNEIKGDTKAFIAGTNSTLGKTLSLTTTALTIDAKRSGLLIAVTAGGAGATSAQGYAIAGSVSINNITNNTTSYITGITGSTGAASLSATDSSSMWVVAGAASLGGKAGIGAAVAVNEISNTTNSSIQDSTITHSQGLSLSSSNDSNIQALSASLGYAKDTVGASGTVSVNRIGNTTEAKLVNFNNVSANGAASTGAISLSANDDSVIYSLSGAVGIGNNTGIGAAAAYNAIGNNVKAYIQSSNIATTEGLTITADSDADIKTLSVGVGGGKKLALAGSLSINEIDNTVAAYIKDSKKNIATPTQSKEIKTGKAITLKASDDSIISNLSGGVALGTSGSAVGAAVSINAIGDNDDSSKGVKAYIENADVSTTGNFNIELLATNNAEIGAIALGAAGGENFALGGSVAVNDIESQADAHISNNAIAQAVGAITVTATDDSEIQTLAGAVGAAKGKAAVAAAVSINDINNRTKAYIDLSQVNSTANSVTVSASETATIQAITAGGAGAGDFAIGGSVSINRIGNHTTAEIRNQSNVNAFNQVDVSGKDNSTIQALAGAVAFGGKAGVGASVVLNRIDNQNQAIIDNAQVTALGLSVNSNQNATIEAISAAGSGGGKAAISGAINLNFIDTKTNSQISNKAKINASQNVAVNSTDNSIIKSLAGQLAVGGTAGVGVSVSTNFVDNQVTATISDAQVTSTGGKVSVQANLAAGVKNASVGASIGGTVGVGGSVSVNNIKTVTDAHISNSAKVNAAQLVEVIASDAAKDVAATSDEEAFSGIQSLAGQVSVGGTAGFGASVSTNNINNTVKADIDNSTVSSNNGITIAATSTPKIENITAGGVGAGTFALGGSVTVNNIGTQTLAYISNNSTISAPQNINVSATNNATIRSLAGQISAAGNAAIGAAVAVNNISGKTEAYISGSSVTSTSGTVKVESKGNNTIESLSAGASVSGQVALTGSVSVNNITDTIQAYVLNGNITANNLNITSQDHATIKSLAGQVSASGGGSVGAAVAYNNIGNSIQAYSQDSTINTAGNVLINADNQGTIETVATGASVGLYAGIAGSVAVNQMSNNVSGYIQGGTLTAQGSVGVLANSVNTLTTYGGTLSGGLAGVGGTVAVNNVDNSTNAYLTGATLKALGNQSLNIPKADGSGTQVAINGLGVIATSKEKLGVIIGTASGGAVGIGVSAVVNSFTDKTKADINGGLINGNNTGANSQQGVYVKAFNDTDVNVKAGTISAGAVGLGAAIDVTTVKNATSASINNATVNTLKDVDVEAKTNKTVNSLTVGGGGGLAVGVQGTVSVLNVGSAISDQGNEAKNNTKSTVSNQLSGLDGMGKDSSGKSNISTKKDVLDDLTPSASVIKGTTAFISGTVNAGGEVTILSDEITKLGITSGALALGGFAGIGGSVGIANVTHNSSAYVGANSNLTVGGNLNITATGLVDSNKVQTIAGAGGLVGLGAAVSYLTSHNNTSAYIDSGTKINQANNINVIAGSSSNLTVESWGAAVGGAAVGIVISNAEESGTTQANLGNGVQIQNANSLNINAIAKEAVSATAQASSGGILSGIGSIPTATVSPTIKAYVGDNGKIQVANDVKIVADVTVDGDAEAKGLSIGAIAVGISIAEVNAKPNIDTHIGAFTTIDATNVTVQSRLGKPITIGDTSFDPSNTINNSQDTIKFNSNHGLQTGAQVVYVNGGGTDISGLTNQSSYNVIAVDSQTVKLGSIFNAADIDVKFNTIKFAQNHGFKDGNKVVYEATGGNVIGGLVAGKTYYVKVVDSKTIKLSLIQSTTQLTQGTSINNINTNSPDTVITINNHGFNTSDQINYVRRTAKFSIVDKLPDTQGKDNIFNLGSDVISKNSINSASHGFENDDQVVYTTDGGSLGGLVNAQTYYIVNKTTNTFQLSVTKGGTAIDITSVPTDAKGNVVDSTHQIKAVGLKVQQVNQSTFSYTTDNTTNTITLNSHGFTNGQAVVYKTAGTALTNLTPGTTYYVKLVNTNSFQLTATSGGAVIDIGANSGTHQLVVNKGTQDLEEGVPYYVVGVTTNTFKLANTAAGTALTLDKSSLTGTGLDHLFTKENVVDLTSAGTGTQNLHIDLDNATATGKTHLLSSGATATIPTQGDNKFSAYSQAAAGGLLGGTGTKATLNITPTMTTYVGNNAAIIAKGNVTVDSLSSVQTTGSTTSRVYGAIAVGASKINVNVTNNNTTYVGDAASVIADGNVVINGQTAQTIDVSGDGGAGSLITFADAEAHANLIYNNNTYIGNYATITAKNDLTVNSTSNTDGKVKVSADGVGIYADADADSSFNVDGSNLTNINSNVKLEGRTVNIQALVDQLNVESRSESEGAGLIGNIDAHAHVDLNGTDSNVTINSGAYIKGDYINLDAKFNTVNSSAIALADCDGLGGDTDSDATNNMPLTAQIWTDSTSAIEVYKLNVESDFTKFNKTTTANSDLAWSLTIWTPFGDITITMDFGTESTSEIYKPTPIIDFNSKVKLLAREENPVLIVDQNGNIIQKSDNVDANITDTDVIVGDIDNASVGEVNFIIPKRSDQMFDNGKFTDNGKYTIIDPAYDTVQIENYSNKNLIINDISVINPGGIPAINYNVNVKNKTINTTLPNLNSLPVNPTIVTINNVGNSDLILQGVIDNPHDRTILYSTDDIFSQGNEQNIITRDLTITAVNGNIGTATQKIKAQLNQGYSPVTSEVPSSKIYLETTAQKSVYLDLTAKQLDTNPVTVNVEKMTATTGEVNLKINQTTDKSNANVTALYDFSNEYNLDNTIKAPSNIIAGTNITIDAGTTTTNINGKTDFLGNGLLDVVTGGYINLTELNGGVKVYRAISDQDYITLTVNESVNSGEDLLLVDNAVVKAAKDAIFLVGDNFQIEPTATITAGNNVLIKGDYNNKDTLGSLVNIYGWIYAQSMSIYGENNKDTFNIRRLATRTNLWAGGDDDVINVGSNQPLNNGNLDEIQKSLTVYGEGQNNRDTLNIDDGGDTSNNTGILTNKSLTGLDMGEGIYYNNFELFNLKLGVANDDLTVLNTGATTNIDGGTGDDKFRFGAKVDANGNVLAETMDGVSTLGQNILGTSHLTNLNTGDGKDSIQVNRNTAVLNIQAGNGDDNLEVNTPIYNSTLLNNAKVNFSGEVGSDKTILNGSSVSETITTNGLEVNVTNSRSLGLSTTENLVINANSGNDVVNIDTVAGSNVTALEVNGNAGSDTVNLFSLLSTITTTINGNQDNDTFNLGSQGQVTQTPTLNQILGKVTIAGNEGTDTVNLKDDQDSTNNTGTLTATTLAGLGLGNTLTYGTLETLNLNLGKGNDTLTVQGTHTGVTNIKANDGNDQVNIRGNSGNTFVWLGQGDDTLNVGSLQPTANGTLSQLTKALTVYGEGQTTGDILNIDNSGDTLTRTGTLTKDALTGLGMGVGITYNMMETLNINLGSGADTFTSLDNGAVTNLNTGAGNDTVRIGANLDADGVPLAEASPALAATQIYGNSYAMTVNAGTGNDSVRVNRNKANLTLQGGDGNDTIELNTASDRTSGLIANGNVTLDGGNGADNTIINGSSRSETITINAQGVQVKDSRTTTLANVENLTVNGNKGSDAIAVNTNVTTTGTTATSSPLTQIQLSGGLDNDTLNVASLWASISLNMTGDRGNDIFNLGNASNSLSQILGAVTIDGNEDTDNLVLNNQGVTTNQTGTVTATAITGFGLSKGITYTNIENLLLNLGSGADTVTVNSTHKGKTTINANAGNDSITVNSIGGSVAVNAGIGNDQLFTKVKPSLAGLVFNDPEGKTPTLLSSTGITGLPATLPTVSTPTTSSGTNSTQTPSSPTTSNPGIITSKVTPPSTTIQSTLNTAKNTNLTNSSQPGIITKNLTTNPLTIKP